LLCGQLDFKTFSAAAFNKMQIKPAFVFFSSIQQNFGGHFKRAGTIDITFMANNTKG